MSGLSIIVQEFLIAARPDLQSAREAWLKMLARERRLSALTVEAYERDSRQFLQFLTGHIGGAPGISDVAQLRPADLRAFLAARRNAGAGALELSATNGVPTVAGTLAFETLDIGMLIGAQAFQETPKHHAPAIVLAVIPNIAAWGKLLIDSALGAAGTNAATVGFDKLGQVGVL